VTNPDNFSGGLGALWEFNEKIDKDMGYVVAPPLIAKFRTGGTVVHSLLILLLFPVVIIITTLMQHRLAHRLCSYCLWINDRPIPGCWVVLLQAFTPIKDATKKNGLGAPNVVYGPNGAVSYAYAGDLQGNMWRFDLRPVTSVRQNLNQTGFYGKNFRWRNTAYYRSAANRVCTGWRIHSVVWYRQIS
jgi:type IV pilus assembly protein PilY1